MAVGAGRSTSGVLAGVDREVLPVVVELRPIQVAVVWQDPQSVGKPAAWWFGLVVLS